MGKWQWKANGPEEISGYESLESVLLDLDAVRLAEALEKGEMTEAEVLAEANKYGPDTWPKITIRPVLILGSPHRPRAAPRRHRNGARAA